MIIQYEVTKKKIKKNKQTNKHKKPEQTKRKIKGKKQQFL